MNIVVIGGATILGAAAGRISTAPTIRGLRAQVRQLTRRVHEDPLTAVLNRSGLEQAYTAAAGRDRYLILLDLDAFKQANDRHGHPAGDRVLAAVGSRLTAVASRLGGWAGRLGGDEFALILPTSSLHVASAAAAEACAPFLIPDLPTGPLSVPGTAGLASARPGYSWSRVLTEADIALYQAKKAGAPVVYEPGMAYPDDLPQLRRQARDASRILCCRGRRLGLGTDRDEGVVIADLLSGSDLECLAVTAVELWQSADTTALTERQQQALQRARDALADEYAEAGDPVPLWASSAPAVWVLRRWDRHDDVISLHADQDVAYAALAAHVRSSWADIGSDLGAPPEPPGDDRQAVALYYGSEGDSRPDEGFRIYPDQITTADQHCRDWRGNTVSTPGCGIAR
ncbi:GGDEF domain-containing protein [Actinoplanes sp. NPDC020271]|uniref:GGDEF domain-containing protein n=1 Tax=Actinoplanes sp. NPDC020271 TaxID=3363896 RepID=UPI0037892380